MSFVKFPRTSISSQSQEIHRLTSLPCQWVLSFPKDPRVEWGCRKKYPSTIKVCRITNRLPTLFTPDEPNSLQSPSASPFSHPSNIRVKIPPYPNPTSLFILFCIIIFIYSYFEFFLFYFISTDPCDMHLCNFICIYAMCLI